MKKYVLIYMLFSSFILLLIEGCSNKMLEAKSVWAANDIAIDGSITDWQEIPVISPGDQNTLNFKLCNDNDYLYTVFYSRNISLGAQIKMTGVKLWIDSAGRKNKKTGLFFSGGPKYSPMRDSVSPEDLFGDKERRFSAENHSMSMKFMGKDKFTLIDDEGDVDVLSKNGINGPALEYGISNGTIIYELKIPLRIKGLASYAIGTDPGDEIKLIPGSTPLLSMESQKPLADFDIIAFSISFENDYPNILKILEMSRINLVSSQRREEDPLVIGGGISVTLNPEPLADFFDLFILGEGEEAIPEFLDIHEESRKGGLSKHEMLTYVQKEVEGAYVPKFYSVIAHRK